MAKNKKKTAAASGGEGIKIVAVNKRATFDYEIIEKLECGIVLQGSEVKSLRDGHVSFTDSYVRVLNDELYLLGMSISEYMMANRLNHHPVHTRKLLAHKREIRKLAMASEIKGHTIVPLRLYFKNSRCKLQIGLGRGKAVYDKRESLKKKDFDRQKQRIMKSYM